MCIQSIKIRIICLIFLVLENINKHCKQNRLRTNSLRATLIFRKPASASTRKWSSSVTNSDKFVFMDPKKGSNENAAINRKTIPPTFMKYFPFLFPVEKNNQIKSPFKQISYGLISTFLV